MANSNGWGDGAANNAIGWGQGANNAIAWGDSHAKSWAGATDIVGLTTDPAASAFIQATGITGATQQAAIDNLVKGLKADGIWSKMKAVYPFVTDNRNLLSYTDTFSNGYWTKDGVTITAGQTDPTGGSNATRVVGTTPSRSLYGLITLTTGATYTLSCYVKSTSGSNQTFRIYANAGAPFSPDLTATSSWQRVTLTFTAAAGNNSFGVTRDSSTNNYDILVYGIQMELGSTATTYQPIATTQQAYIASQFKYNLVNPVDSDAAFRLVFNGGWTHSSNGATPNGTNGFANTFFTPNNLSQNNNAIGFYSRTNIIAAETDMGTVATDINSINMGANYLAAGAFARNFNASFGGFTNTDTRGFYINTRVSSTENKMYKNASLLGTIAAISGTPPTAPNIAISGEMNLGNTSARYYSSKQFAFAFMSDGFNSTDASNLYTRVQAYQTALSRNV